MTDTVERTVSRIENQVLNIQDDVREIKDLIMAQNGRVRKLELDAAESKGGWKVAGIIGGIAGTVASLIPKWLS